MAAGGGAQQHGGMMMVMFFFFQLFVSIVKKILERIFRRNR